MINLIKDIEREKFNAFLGELNSYTRGFLERVANNDPQLEKLKNIVYVEKISEPGSHDGETYYYTYAFRSVGEVDRPNVWITINHGKPFLRVTSYNSNDTNEGETLVEKIENSLAEENILVRMPYAEYSWSSDYISIAMAYYYRRYGDVDRAITETIELFKDAEPRTYSGLADYFYQLP